MKLDRDRIVEAAMATFTDHGYDGLSRRRVATRLDVQAGSLYYHVRNKDDLVRLMAVQLTALAVRRGTEALATLPDDADLTTRVVAQLLALRVVLLDQPGVAYLLARSQGVLSEPALALMDGLIGTFEDERVPLDRSARFTRSRHRAHQRCSQRPRSRATGVIRDFFDRSRVTASAPSGPAGWDSRRSSGAIESWEPLMLT